MLFRSVHVKDVFGDNGITGLIGLHKTEKNEIFIDDFVMSCRVMGRKIEDKMLEFVIEKSKIEKSLHVIFEHIETEKNRPVLDFIKRQGHQSGLL